MRGRRMVIAWQDDEAALYQRYRAEPDAEVRTRWHALWLIRQGRTATEAATLVGVERRSVQRWLAWYRRGGPAAVAQHRRGGRQGRAALLTPAQQAALTAEAARGTIRTVGEAVAWVAQQFGVTYTYWGMRSLLHRRQIGRKVPRPLAVKASLEAQAAWNKGGSPRR
jgi:transposase